MKLGSPRKLIMAIFGRNSGKTAAAAAAVQRFQNVSVPKDPSRCHRVPRYDLRASGGFGQSYGQKCDRAKGWLS
jgi:hypothetical protein